MKYIFELNSDNNYKIEFKKTDLKYDITVFEEYSKIHEKIREQSKKNKDIEYRDLRTRFFNYYGEGLKFILEHYGFKEYNIVIINKINKLNCISVEKLMLNDENKKNFNLKVRINDRLFKKFLIISLSNRQLLHNKCIIVLLYNLYDILEIGGNLNLPIYNYSSFITIEIIYLLLIFFEKVIFITGNTILCLNYKGTNKKNIVEKIFYNNLNFKIIEKNNFDKLIKYLHNIFYMYEKQYNLLLNDEKKFILEKKKYIENIFKEIKNFNDKYAIKYYINEYFLNYYKYKKIMMNTIQNNYHINIIPEHTKIEKYTIAKGNLLTKYIIKFKLRKCLQLGFNDNTFTPYILKNNKVKLLIIDNDINIDTKIYGSKYNFSKKKIYLELPYLLRKYGNDYYDLIFIDDINITYTELIIYIFYINYILNIYGILIINNISNKNVIKIIKFIELNFSSLLRIDNNNYLLIYKKVIQQTKKLI